jgi:hypothetical protein
MTRLDAALADGYHRGMGGVPFLLGLPGACARPMHGVTARVTEAVAGLLVTAR